MNGSVSITWNNAAISKISVWHRKRSAQSVDRAILGYPIGYNNSATSNILDLS